MMYGPHIGVVLCLSLEIHAIVFGKVSHLLQVLDLFVASVGRSLVAEFRQLVTGVVHVVEVYQLESQCVTILSELINSLISTSGHK